MHGISVSGVGACYSDCQRVEQNHRGALCRLFIQRQLLRINSVIGEAHDRVFIHRYGSPVYGCRRKRCQRKIYCLVLPVSLLQAVANPPGFFTVL